MYNPVRSGDLIHQIVVSSKVEAQTSSGALTHTWQTYATLWANVDLSQGSETRGADQVRSKVQGEAVIRYRTDIDTTMRVTFKGAQYDIAAVLPDERFVDHLRLILIIGESDDGT